MSEFWKELKDEIEDAVFHCEFSITTEVQNGGSYFCGIRWIPCTRAIARGQCEMINKNKETDDV